MSDEAKKDIQFSIRVTSDLHDRVLEEAEDQKRTRNNMVRVILEEYFENKDRVKKIAERK
ncbi:hypothetical protein FACS189425_11260 [Clostridia bacterium]|nr:hypothetical protein FACS189425_11260 [Clostridia bacterium]